MSPPRPGHPVTRRDAWRDACWQGDAHTEAAVLHQWRLDADDVVAAGPPDGDHTTFWLAAFELERAAGWPAVRDRRTGEAQPRLHQLERIAARIEDPVEAVLAKQAVDTDRLRSLRELDWQLCARVERAVHECACGSPGQRARAALNAAWATKRFHHESSRRWAQHGLAELGPVSRDTERPRRELALHLLQQAGAFLPSEEQVVLTASMLNLLAPEEYPMWRARTLLRRWAAQQDTDPDGATHSLSSAVAAAARSARARTIWEAGSQCALGATMRHLPETQAARYLRILLSAARSCADPLAPQHIRGFLVEQLVAIEEFREADEVGSAALAALESMASDPPQYEGGTVPVAQCWSMWAVIARSVAAARVGRDGSGKDERCARPVHAGPADVAGAAQLLRRCALIHESTGQLGQAALVSLELAHVHRGAGQTGAALTALLEAVAFARRGGDRDLQARAYAVMPAVAWSGEGSLAALAACDSSEKAIDALLAEIDDAPAEDFPDDHDRALERGLVMCEALELKRDRAEILAEAGGLTQALDALDGVDGEFLDTGYDAQAAEVMMTRGYYLAQLGRREQAEAAWQDAAAVAAANRLPWLLEDVLSVWTGYLRTEGRVQEADLVRQLWLSPPAGEGGAS